MSEPSAPEDAGRRGRPADAVLAAELALGVLDAEARARAEARAAGDDAFAADAARWSAELAPLVEEAAPVAPSEALWARIAQAAGLEPEPARAAPAPAAARAPAAAATPLRPVQPVRGLRFWRGTAIGALTLAAASVAAALFLAVKPGGAGGPLLAARLDPPAAGTATLVGSEPLFTATLDPVRAAVVLTPIRPGPVDPRARELWVIPKGGAPIAAGMVDVARTRPLPLSPALLTAARAGATLAVTLEPAGGSPSGKPTGPVVAAGVLAAI